MFFLIKGVELGPRPKVTRGPPLDKWEEFLDAEGRVMNPEHIKKLVFKGVKFMNFFFLFRDVLCSLGFKTTADCL